MCFGFGLVWFGLVLLLVLLLASFCLRLGFCFAFFCDFDFDFDFGDFVFCSVFYFLWCPSLYILVNLCWFYSCITYVITFWRLSSHNKDIVEFWCGVDVPICMYFSKFLKNSKRFFFFFRDLCSFFHNCDPMLLGHRVIYK